MEINGYKIIQTCSVCPEQYDVFKNNQQVGYLRLRYGCFTANCPDVEGKEVYFAIPKGVNSFEEDEREFYLNNAIKAINRYLQDV
jgi:hypothetical protein